MITATITFCVQIGPDDFETRRVSNNFTKFQSIDDILMWAERQGVKDPTINSVVLSEFAP